MNIKSRKERGSILPVEMWDILSASPAFSTAATESGMIVAGFNLF